MEHIKINGNNLTDDCGDFASKLKESKSYPLKSTEIEIFQINVGRRCNLMCKHCHVEATPDSEKVMSKEVLQECFCGRDGVCVDDIFKMLRLVENMSVGAGLPEAMHGAGSPAAQKIMIARRSGIERKRALAECIARISKDEHFEKIIGLPEDHYWKQLQAKLKGKDTDPNSAGEK